MIECPICRVMNEDMARFCAECGQRLSAPTPPPVPSAAPPSQQAAAPPSPGRAQDPAKASGFKLHSPLLEGDDAGPFDAGTAYSTGKSDLSRLRGTGSRGGNSPPEPRPGRKGGLHSPLLGGDDTFDEPPPQPKRKGGLHSPLLGGDDAYDEPPPRPSGKGGLRSPLLGDDYDEPQRPSGNRPGGLRSPSLGGGGDMDSDDPGSGRGLRSPLLGGGPGGYEGAYDSSPRGRAPQGGGRPGHLHSPLLGGGETYFDDYDEPPIDDDDPNVLRSPLLAARVPKTERPQPKPEPPQSFSPGQQPGGPQPVPPQAPAPQPISPQPLSPQPLAPQPVPPRPQPEPAGFGQPSPPGPGPGAPNPILGGSLASDPMVRSAPSEPLSPPAGNQVPLAAALGGRTAPTSVPPGQLPPVAEEPRQAPVPSAAELRAIGSKEAAEPDVKPIKRGRPMGGKKFAVEIEDDEPELSEPPPRFAGGRGADRGAYQAPPAGGNPLAKMLVLPLVLALGLKAYGLMDFAGKNQLMPAYLCSEVGAMIAIICVIVLCLTSGNSGGR